MPRKRQYATNAEPQDNCPEVPESWSKLEQECFALTATLVEDKTTAKNFRGTINQTKIVLKTYLSEVRDRLNSQGARNDRKDTPKIGWQAWVEQNKEKLGFTLRTANRYCGDKPKPPVKVIALKEDVIVSLLVGDVDENDNEIEVPMKFRIIEASPCTGDFHTTKERIKKHLPKLVNITLEVVEQPKPAPAKAPKKSVTKKNPARKTHAAYDHGKTKCHKTIEDNILIAGKGVEPTCGICLSVIEADNREASYEEFLKTVPAGTTKKRTQQLWMVWSERKRGYDLDLETMTSTPISPVTVTKPKLPAAEPVTKPTGKTHITFESGGYVFTYCGRQVVPGMSTTDDPPQATCDTCKNHPSMVHAVTAVNAQEKKARRQAASAKWKSMMQGIVTPAAPAPILDPAQFGEHGQHIPPKEKVHRAAAGRVKKQIECPICHETVPFQKDGETISRHDRKLGAPGFGNTCPASRRLLEDAKGWFEANGVANPWEGGIHP